MNKIFAILEKKLEKEGRLGALVSQLDLTQRFEDNWEAIFGRLAAQFSFGSYRDGVLCIYAKNPIWITEFSAYKQQLINSVRSVILDLELTDIIVKKK